MPEFRIFRMKEHARQQFRWAPHTIGATSVKPKDYEFLSTVEAPTVYRAWMSLKGSKDPLQIGDILECGSGELRIYKYVGFEEAQWVMPEVKSGLENALPAQDPSPAAP
jgi:hypothetical protein